MTPEIQEAIHRGKTCAPARCSNERACFVLACELERLYSLQDAACIENTKYDEMLKNSVASNVDFTTSDPTFENPNPIWLE